MSYRTSVPVRFGDLDSAGIVYYPRYFMYYHDAFEAFFGAGGLPYHDVVGKQRIGFPSVHAECDYAAPLRHGDTLELELAITRIGTKSATFRYVGHRRSDGKKACEAKVVVACIDMDTFESMPFPDHVRALFATIAVAP